MVREILNRSLGWEQDGGCLEGRTEVIQLPR